VLECVRGPRVADGTCGPRPRKEPRVATRKRACTRPRIHQLHCTGRDDEPPKRDESHSKVAEARYTVQEASTTA